jgi:uncharacterized protein
MLTRDAKRNAYVVTVQELHTYPLKSGRGIAWQRVKVVPTGFLWDRHWMLVNAQGQFLSQRSHPVMAQIRTSIDASGLHLQLGDAPPLHLPLEPWGEPVAVRVWSDDCEGFDQGAQARAWASRALGEPVRVVRMPASPRRMANARYAGPTPTPVSFSDGFPVLVCNRTSLHELNRRMPEPVGMERFRPNLVLEGLPAFAEDRIDAVRIGAVTLKLVKPCTRCVITATDQLTGERSTNPLAVLREFRMDKSLKGVTFGENAVPAHGVGHYIEVGARCDIEYGS